MDNIKLEKIVWKDLTPYKGLKYFSEGKNELAWTQKAWLILEKEGLTKYAAGNRSEKIKVFARYIALSILRYQFSEIINDENYITNEFDIDYSDFVADFSKYNVTSFDLGYLMALEKQWDYIGEDPELLDTSAFRYYVNKYSRKEVIEGLKRRLGSPSEILFFFYKLVDLNADRSILNDPGPNNLRAYSWIDNDFVL